MEVCRRPPCSRFDLLGSGLIKHRHVPVPPGRPLAVSQLFGQDASTTTGELKNLLRSCLLS